MIYNIIVCGVGGQGTLLASNLIAECALRAGFDVKKSEVHGMAQRGGSVVSHVRFGSMIYSPLVRKGEVDYILAFEQLEGLRWAEYIKPNGLVILNNQKIMPMSVTVGNSKYPENIKEIIESLPAKVLEVPALDIALEIGNPKCVNVVLLGVLAKKLRVIEKSIWDDVILEKIPSKYLEINQTAFERGWNFEN